MVGHTESGMGAGDGVSFTTVGRHRWKLRWRERAAEGGWRARAMTIEGSHIDRDELMVEIRRALSDHGRYDPETSALVAGPPANLEDVLKACIDARKAAGKYTAKTAQTYTAYRIRFLTTVRELKKIDKGEPVPGGERGERIGAGPVPVTLLSRDLFDLVHARDVARASSTMMMYAPARFVLDAWRWAHDANEEAEAARRPPVWLHLPPAPRSTKDYLPRTPTYGRTIAPTMQHIDAVIRRLWARGKVDGGTKVAALFMRYTGLRSEQVFSIVREDIDLEQRTLFVRTGKTKAEKADARTVPLAENLLGEPGVRGYLESFTALEPIFPKRRHRKTKDEDAPRSKKPTETFKMVWQEAEAANEVPGHVWRPPNRKISRPEHSFRAAFQAYLEEQRVPGNVIDFLVGHEGESVRDVHYGRELLDGARQAVDRIPAVEWLGEPEVRDNVVSIAEAVRRLITPSS